MSQDESWILKYNEVKDFIVKNKRNPSKFIPEERGLRNWVRHQQKLVKALFEQVINPYLKDSGKTVYNLERIHEINDSKYQGCLLYVIPLDNYEPSSCDYVLTFAEYGSCPVCDTLEGIWEYYRIANNPDETVRDLMNLCLHLLQHCKIPYSYNETLDNE